LSRSPETKPIACRETTGDSLRLFGIELGGWTGLSRRKNIQEGALQKGTKKTARKGPERVYQPRCLLESKVMSNTEKQNQYKIYERHSQLTGSLESKPAEMIIPQQI